MDSHFDQVMKERKYRAASSRLRSGILDALSEFPAGTFLQRIPSRVRRRFELSRPPLDVRMWKRLPLAALCFAACSSSPESRTSPTPAAIPSQAPTTWKGPLSGVWIWATPSESGPVEVDYCTIAIGPAIRIAHDPASRRLTLGWSTAITGPETPTTAERAQGIEMDERWILRGLAHTAGVGPLPNETTTWWELRLADPDTLDGTRDGRPVRMRRAIVGPKPASPCSMPP